MNDEIKIGDLVVFRFKDAAGSPLFLTNAKHGIVTDIMCPDRWPGTNPSSIIEVRWSGDWSRPYHHDRVQLKVISR